MTDDRPAGKDVNAAMKALLRKAERNLREAKRLIDSIDRPFEPDEGGPGTRPVGDRSVALRARL